MKRLTGIAAATFLAALLAGVPVLLLWLTAPLIPDTLPSWDQIGAALTSRDDGTLIIYVILAAAWVAWLYLAIALLTELVAAIRRVEAPHLPGFSFPQGIAKKLVAAAMLTVVSTGALAGAAHAEPPVPPSAGSHAITTAAPVTADAAPSKVQTPSNPDAHSNSVSEVRTISHVVGPGDTLYKLAQRYLGDGWRYPEIYHGNKGITQSNGRPLNNPHLIIDGTTLTITVTRAPTTQQPIPHTIKRGETWASIAKQYLGTSHRADELHAANPHVTDLKPGSTLSVVVSNPHRPAPTPQPAEPATPVTDNQATEHPHPTTPAAPPSTTPTPSPNTSPPVAAPTENTTAQKPSDDGPVITAASAVEDHDGFPTRTLFGVGVVLAAGVVSLISGRRTVQRRRLRDRGAPLAMPAAAAASIERDLRVVATPWAVEDVDTALRGLARHCAATHQPLPELRAARLTATTLELYITEPAELPAPWTGTSDSTLWSLHCDHAPRQETDTDELRDVPAPYPALATLGQDEEGAHILLDLETVGELEIVGEQQLAEETLAALALELATSTWADDLMVTIVGSFPEMEDVFQTGRIRYLPTVGRLFEELNSRAAADRLTMRIDDTPDLHHARVTAKAPSAWFPEIVLLTHPLTDTQTRELDQLVAEMPRVAIATAAIRERGTGEWVLNLEDPDRAQLHPFGLTIRPQHIETAAYRGILEIVETTGPESQAAQNTATTTVVNTLVDDVTQFLTTHPNPKPEQPSPETEPTPMPAPASETADEPCETADEPCADTDDSNEAATVSVGPREDQPYLKVLGLVELVNAPGPVEPNRAKRLLEYLAYLMFTPNVTGDSIDDAIWPNRKTQKNNQRDPSTSKLRHWLGTTADDGQPRLAPRTYQVSDVGSDWHDFQRLIGDGPLDQVPTTNLKHAVSLIGGVPFKATGARYYAWAEELRQTMITRVVDVCCELATRQLVDENWADGEHTLAKAIDIEPGDEELWRMRILAAYARHNQPAVDEAIARLYAQLDALMGDDAALEDETELFLTQLRAGAPVNDLMEMI